MISGFVIFNSSKGRTASQFIVARALRLYPAFMFSVGLTGVVILLFGGPITKITFSQFLANFSMLAPAFGEKHLDASYWTLGVELKFYVMVFALILVGFSSHLEKIFLVWAATILLAAAANFGAVPSMSGYASYFCAGALFAVRTENKNTLLNVLLAGCLYYSLLFSCINSPELKEVEQLAPSIIAGCICLFYSFFWALSSGKLASIKLPAARQLGVLTYPLYLVHQAIGYIIIRHFATEQNKLVVVGLTMFAMILLGLFVHYFAEILPAKFWKVSLNSLLGRPVSLFDTWICKAKRKVAMLGSAT